MSRSRLLPLTLGLTLGLALALSGCGLFGDDDKEVRAAADALASAFAAGDLTTVAFTETGAAEKYAAIAKPLAGATSEVEVADLTGEGGTRTVTLRWSTAFPGYDAAWEHTSTAELVPSEGTWKVVWRASVVEESLQGGETLVVKRLRPERGNILGSGGTPLVESRPVVRFGLDKTQVPAAVAASSARRLAALVDISAAPFVRAVAKAGPKAFVPAVVLRRTEVSAALLAGVARIKGARGIDDRLPLAPTKDFASAILGTVGPATAELIKKSGGRLADGDLAGFSGLQLRYDETLGGTSGYEVVAKPVLEEASDLVEDKKPRVLFSAAPTPGKPITVTLDTALQKTAQGLLTRYGPASALVAIRPSTGEVLVAASGPGSDGYNTATFGQYAPGSTFKVVSSLALLRAGLTPASPVSCPATVTVNGKQFKNYSDYPAGKLGRITLREAVANSCNTAFIASRGKITGTALADAAAALGFGVDHDLGFPAYFGQVPSPGGETEAAADLIGQGKILASPMAMAAVAASVVKGATVLPSLVPAETPGLKAPAEPLTKAEAVSLRALLRAVVEEGSGSFLRTLSPPAVLAKTGTAEYGTSAPLPTHAWMIGAQGDLAVAVFVADGQSGSRTAGPVLAEFLRAAR